MAMVFGLVTSILAGDLRKSGSCTLPVFTKTHLLASGPFFTVSLEDSNLAARVDFCGETVAVPGGSTNYFIRSSQTLTNKAINALSVSVSVVFCDTWGELVVSILLDEKTIPPRAFAAEPATRAAPGGAPPRISSMPMDWYMMPVPKEVFRRIASYKLVLYANPVRLPSDAPQPPGASSSAPLPKPVP